MLLPIGLALALVLWVTVRAYRAEARSLEGAQFPMPQDALSDLPEVKDVAFRAGDHEIKGWFFPGTRPGAVLLVHGSGSSRLATKDELKLLGRAGFSVLTYDQPGHGESEGRPSYGPSRREALLRAIDFLAAQPGVERVGALGLSYGGYDLIHVAATTDRVHAIAVAGTPGDLERHGRYEYSGAFGLRFFGAKLAMRAYDIPLEEPTAESVIARLSPRPILFLQGEKDHTVPKELVFRLYEAALPPKTWVDLPESGHCDYAERDPELYARTLESFFSEALAAPRDPH